MLGEISNKFTRRFLVICAAPIALFAAVVLGTCAGVSKFTTVMWGDIRAAWRGC